MNLKRLLFVLLIVGALFTFGACDKECKTHVDENNNGVCDVCGHAHNYNQQNTDDTYFAEVADCENATKYYLSCACGAKGSETFESGDAVGHSYTEEIADADYLATDADCENAATYYHSCSACGAKGETTFASGDAIGHVDEDGDSLCDVCNKSYSGHAHNYNQENTDKGFLAEAADCENAAKYYLSCACGAKGETTFISGESLGHDFTVQDASSKYAATAANCETAATYYYSCSACGAKGEKTFEKGQPLVHRDADDNDLCDHCGKSYSDGIEPENCPHLPDHIDNDADLECDVCKYDLFVPDPDNTIESPKHELGK